VKEEVQPKVEAKAKEEAAEAGGEGGEGGEGGACGAYLRAVRGYVTSDDLPHDELSRPLEARSLAITPSPDPFT
jgi:hypothetical protein